MRDRSTKYGHHCVSDELLDDPTERLDLGPEPRVIAVENRADVLGIEKLGTGGEPGHVGEQDRHDPPLLVCLCWRTQQRGTTAVAKAGSLWILLSAGLAGGHGAVSVRPRPTQANRATRRRRGSHSPSRQCSVPVIQLSSLPGAVAAAEALGDERQLLHGVGNIVPVGLVLDRKP